MKKYLRASFVLIFLTLNLECFAHVCVGIGTAEITPPIGTPSAGYPERKGAGVEDVHDPLMAIALFIDTGDKKIALCSVDHLGFTYDMVQTITKKVQSLYGLETCEVYIGSSHTHSGGGSYLNIPVLGEQLAGVYNPKITEFYIEQTYKAIFQAVRHKVPANIGIGYGHAEGLSCYRAKWPEQVAPLTDLMLIKVTRTDGSPFAALFNFPVHPTILTSENRQFSADFVGYARQKISSCLGVKSLYFNGAQGDINPVIHQAEDRYASCAYLGNALAEQVLSLWNTTQTSDQIEIKTLKETYSFKPKTTPFGLLLPVEDYSTELNLLVLGQSSSKHAFVTIPGELSCIYDAHLKKRAHQLGYTHLSILGLTNDAHGYIITPEAWRYPTKEAALSFGGEDYGEEIEKKVYKLLIDAK